ncbi:hypothetical protein EHM94_18335 [Marinobacter sp. NP-6]|uniref:ethylbenzene dehydrogenase-related protein n=1 Tax=Marinobacter sp. NP-6 TaxID=2488666 RepID=UPI000FCB8B89|nr:ethylbenzene dehydrogenase-related protein [Marinobacter sp. NP-6]RUT76986.1 hypothetical protein EHM94_18335 [Marinobacter sp. NP-6]
MKSIRVSDIAMYRDPEFSGWSKVATETVKMMPSPLAMQPTAYIRKSREGMSHGDISELKVACVHDGETLAIYLSWKGVSPEGYDFPDAAAVAFPIKGKPALILMGSKDAPLHILHWKANKGVKSMMAAGIGLSDEGPALKISSQAHSAGDRWHVVLTRMLGKGAGVAPVYPGLETQVGFAIWHGKNDERAGLKSFSIDWQPFVLEA